MRKLRLITAGTLLASGLVSSAAGATAPRPGVTELVSVSSSGTQGNDVSGVGQAPIAITPDGRRVAFVSAASNLVPDDINQQQDVFVRDRLTGKTVMASVPSPGTVAKIFGTTTSFPCPAQYPAISANGRYVAFSTCRALDGKAPDSGTDVWVHDFVTGVTTRVSVTYDGSVLLGGASMPSISDDGRYIAFESTATNLVHDLCPGDTVSHELCTLLGAHSEVYVRDMVRKTTTLASLSTSGSVGDGDAYNPAISPDGHMVVFTSNASTLVSNDHNTCISEGPTCADVYVRDLRKSTTQLVSVGLDGQAPMAIPGFGDGADFGEQASVSADDRYIAFQSGESDLVPATASPLSAIAAGASAYYVRDLKLQRTVRVSVTSSGEPLPISRGTAMIDRTGRYVTFDAVEACGSGATTTSFSVAVHDLVTGATRLLDRVDANGAEMPCTIGFTSSSPVIASGGRYVAFGSDAANLVHHDTNKRFDVFVRDEGAALGIGRIVASARAAAAASSVGTRLSAATVVYRPSLHDIFVRLDVTGMQPLAVIDPSLGYAVDLRSGGASYRLSATAAGGSASFRLWRSTPSGWQHIADVNGGYGTTGQQVVAAIPLSALGAHSAGDVTAIDARTTTGDILRLR
jgi:hypothetical protein